MKIIFILLLGLIISGKGKELKGVEYCQERKPIFLFHGIIGSVINAHLNITNTTDIPQYCPTVEKDVPLWISPMSLIPKLKDCIPLYLEMQYDSKSDSMKNRDGVDTYYPYDTSVEGISSLSPKTPIVSSLIKVFENVINHLDVMGYVDTDDLQAAAFDWRLLIQKKDWKETLTQRIESAVKEYGYKAVLIGHSMGGLVIHDFLEEKKQSWIDRYIHKVITVSTPWGGSLKALRALLSGDNMDLPDIILSDNYFLKSLRSFESIYGLLLRETPKNKNDIVLTINGTKYTIKDSLNVLEKYSNNGIFPSYTKKLLNVATREYTQRKKEYKHLCVYGTGIKTEEHLEYTTDLTLISTKYTTKGDGTVNQESLMMCSEFEAELLEIPNETHLGILESDVFVKRIQQEVCSSDEYNSDTLSFFDKVVLFISSVWNGLLDFIYDLITAINELLGFDVTTNELITQ